MAERPSLDRISAAAELLTLSGADLRLALEEKRALYSREEFDAAAMRLASELLGSFNRGYEDDRRSRLELAGSVYGLVVGWLAVTVVLIVCSAVTEFKVPDGVLTAMITGAAAGLIGLLGTIITYYFTRAQEAESIIRAIFSSVLRPRDEDEPRGAVPRRSGPPRG